MKYISMYAWILGTPMIPIPVTLQKFAMLSVAMMLIHHYKVLVVLFFREFLENTIIYRQV